MFLRAEPSIFIVCRKGVEPKRNRRGSVPGSMMKTLFKPEVVVRVLILGVLCYMTFDAVIARADDPSHEEAVLALRREGVEIGQTSFGYLAKFDSKSDKAPIEVFKNLQFIKGLNEFVISTEKADDRLARIASLPNLKFISIYWHVSDQGLKHLSEHTDLKILRIHDASKVTDAGLVHLQALKNLESLKLLRTKVTKQGIDKLYKHLPKCLAEID
jgi:hypothetical protein